MYSSVVPWTRLKCRCCVAGFPAAAAADRGQDVVRASGGGAWHQTSDRSRSAGLWSEGSNLYRYVCKTSFHNQEEKNKKEVHRLPFTLNPMSLDEISTGDQLARVIGSDSAEQ